MKFDMGQAWTDAVALLSKNRDLVVILAAVFLFLPSLALGVLAPTTELEAIMEANPDGFQDAAAAYAAESWPYMLAYLLFSFVGTLAILALLGRPQRPTVGEAIAIGFKTLVPYLLASLITGLIVGFVVAVLVAIGSVAGAAAAALLGFVAFIAVVFLFFRLILIGPIMAIDEELNPIRAIGRSWNLVKGNTRYVAAFMILLWIALIVLSIVGGMIFGVLGALAPAGSIATWVTALFEALIGAIGSAVFLAVYAAIHRQLSSGAPEQVSKTFE